MEPGALGFPGFSWSGKPWETVGNHGKPWETWEYDANISSNTSKYHLFKTHFDLFGSYYEGAVERPLEPRLDFPSGTIYLATGGDSFHEGLGQDQNQKGETMLAE